MPGPTSDSYDVVVIGAGLGGLSGAACLAKAGKRVLVVERQDGPGGNAHVFHRGPYTFDPAIHVTGQGFNVPFLDFYLGALGVADDLELITAEEFGTVVVDGTRFTAPNGVEAFTEFMCEQFPAGRDGIRGFLDVCASATRESQAPPPKVAVQDLQAMIDALPTLFKYRTRTLADALDEFVSDDQAKTVLGGWWPYLGLPPSKLSFMAYSGALMALVDHGPQYPKGSFQRLADALAAAIERNGGELVYGRTVTGIQVTDGAATGVVVDGADAISAPVVISNGDAVQTFESLVGAEHVPERFRKRLRRMRPSLSGFVVFAAGTLDPRQAGLGHEAFVYRHWDHDRTYEDIHAGRPGGTWFSFPTMHDPSLAPPGEHILMFSALAPYDIGRPWEEAKDDFQEQMLQLAETALPGYRASLTFVESATPETFERYTLSQGGAAYGWENTPDQTTPKRLDNRSPVPGLYLAGHWSQPGPASVRCLFSGVQAAAIISEADDPIAFLGTLQG